MFRATQSQLPPLSSPQFSSSSLSLRWFSAVVRHGIIGWVRFDLAAKLVETPGEPGKGITVASLGIRFVPGNPPCLCSSLSCSTHNPTDPKWSVMYIPEAMFLW